MSNRQVEKDVEEVFKAHKRRYGSRRIVSELKDRSISIGRHKVSRILRKKGLCAIQPKSFVPRTTTGSNLYRSPNLLLERPKVERINEVWVGDITYLPIQSGGWVYLSNWLDLYSRKIVGWSVMEHMEDELVVKSLIQGVTRDRPESGLIIHADGGGQYKSNRFRIVLDKHEFEQSMTRKDNHYDNATAESLFSRLKAELLEGGKFRNIHEAQLECFDYIENYYNIKRKHSQLGYKSPIQFEREMEKKNNQTELGEAGASPSDLRSANAPLRSEGLKIMEKLY